MQIIIENYVLETAEENGFHLTELRKSESAEGKKTIREVKVGYNMSLVKALNTIVRRRLHDKDTQVSISQYIKEYKYESSRLEKLLELELIKKG